ncbi:hypothetical protein ACWDLL_26315 [Streptomyces griseoincarnatus]
MGVLVAIVAVYGGLHTVAARAAWRDRTGALLLNVLPRWAIVPIAQRLWLRLTRQGKDVCSGHLAALRAIVGSPGLTL